MLSFLKRYKIVIVFVLTDLFLFWLLFYSGLVLPFINPSIEEYRKSVTSFPRSASQMYLWIYLHFPTSFAIGSIFNLDVYLSLSVIQTGLIVYIVNKLIQRRRVLKVNF